MTSKLVVGLGFGDEGKGMFTDYLCSKSPNSLVIRFSGGHQAGHTVVIDVDTDREMRHVFANFGSGTLRGSHTYWSKYCTVEPIGLLNELAVLKSNGVDPIIYIDGRCPVTTPYEMISNRTLERKNGHGTCGVGFGETLRREESYYSLTFADLFYPVLVAAKLNSIQKNYYNGMGLCDLSNFFAACEKLINTTNVKKVWAPPKCESCVFEGSQGLMLDQDFGIFPNVTRASTGSKNVLEFSVPKEVYLVTRAYQTRHGAGFMTNAALPHNIAINRNETNVKNRYQGEFRRALLDVSLLEYAIEKDDFIRELPSYGDSQGSTKSLVITCLDHVVNEYRFTYRGGIMVSSTKKEFVSKIANFLGINSVYLSRSENSKSIEHIFV